MSPCHTTESRPPLIEITIVFVATSVRPSSAVAEPAGGMWRLKNNELFAIVVVDRVVDCLQRSVRLIRVLRVLYSHYVDESPRPLRWRRGQRGRKEERDARFLLLW